MPAAIAAPAAAESGAVPIKRGKKKLLIIVAAALSLALATCGGGVWYLKKRAAQAAAEAAGEDEGASAEAARADARAEHKGGVPVYLPLDPFIINLADKDVDRYAQIGITLELESPVFADQVKSYMPAVRNAILLILAHKTSRELLGRAGKEDLAEEIMREAVRPMGIEIARPEPVTQAPGGGASGVETKTAQDEAPVRAKKAKKATASNPVQHVHFSSFIIQ